MDKIIKNILEKIESEGYEAYIVGGFVRDKILGRNSFDVDICTNALPKDLKNIFPVNNSNTYGGFNLKIKNYNIDITTYRKEIKYENRKPVEIEYISSLFEDIKRRDFTINSLCLDKNDNLIDVLQVKDDLDNKVIKTIGPVNEKFIEDPLRMLRAIRFATILDFEIEKDTFEAIKSNYQLTSLISNTRIKEELSKILSSENYDKGLNLLKETKISEIIKLKFDNVKYSNDLIGMWAQIECPKVDFTKNELENIKAIKSILNINKINNFVLFNNGLYISLVAGEILGYSKKSINKMYQELPIYSMKDIAISGTEIIKLLDIKPSNLISEIMKSVKVEILNGNLKNKKVDIKKYILEKWHNE